MSSGMIMKCCTVQPHDPSQTEQFFPLMSVVMGDRIQNLVFPNQLSLDVLQIQSEDEE